MRVLLLSKYGRLGASSRVRSHQYLPYLEANGFEVTVAPLLGDDYVRGRYAGRGPGPGVLGAYLGRCRRIRAGNAFDLVWIEKEMLPWLPDWLELGLLPRRVPMLADYDDAVFHWYDGHRSSWVRRLLGTKIDAVMRRASLVVAGNDYLAARARSAGAKRVEVLPTVVSVGRYGVARRPAGAQVTIGWIGSPATAHYLEGIAPALREASAGGRARIVAIGARPDQLHGLPVEARPWSEDTEVAEIQRLDIGIMPVPDAPFERGKCGYKLIQYMACGLPVVASPVGANASIVRDGVEGFHATTGDDWNRALRTLCGDADMRRRFGIAARRRVEAEYSLESAETRLASMLRSAANR
jgi:glycosyltransferase involved in cell wall biosynthesis